MHKDALLHYYQRELNYLRNAGGRFALQYPKVAKRLELGPTQSADPHVERLIESFAFLSARLQKDIDDNFSRVTSALLGVMYPHMVNPLPSLAIACLEQDPGDGQLTTGHTIPRGSPLFAEAKEGEVCRFRTCYDATLWPIHIEKAEVVAADRFELPREMPKTSRVLRLQLVCDTGPFGELPLDSLRLHLGGDQRVRHDLYEALFLKDAPFVFGSKVEETQTWNYVESGSVTPVGFSEDESLFPFMDRGYDAYRLLYEYFHFQDKFLFFDIHGFKTQGIESDTLDVLIALPDEARLDGDNVSAANFLLGCVPIINLFSKTSEPIHLDQRSVEYRLVADFRRERTTEVHSIRQVFSAENIGDDPEEIAPYFGYNHALLESGCDAFWHVRRRRETRPGFTGSDMLLTFVGPRFDPKRPPVQTVFADVWCTNRSLAEQIPAGGILQSEEGLPVQKIYCLERPCATRHPPQEGETQWRLISQMSLNHLSLTCEEEGLKALKEMLRLHADLQSAPIIPEIKGIQDMKASVVTRRVGQDAWRGFTQGVKISLTLDEDVYAGTSAFLFATVLSRFFGLYGALNSFSELEVYRAHQPGVWKIWPPQAGDKPLH
ncbi:MAG: type VI secretion system baseplate subunit TssF [bacterium]|nr:type VI secretion system baseplate subunit TssF [bacterium]